MNSHDEVPVRTKLGAWPARIAGKKVARSVATGLEQFGIRMPSTQRPARSIVSPGPYFAGKALSWQLVENAAGKHVEVELHRQPCNEIGTTALRELEELAAFVSSGANGAKALVMYSSVEKGFSAGADLRELHAGLVAKHDSAGNPLAKKVAVAYEVRGFVDRIHAAFDVLDQAPMTTVAMVHGFCFGGGFELALTCDVLVAEKSARFAFPELRLGLVPGFGGIPRLERDVGNAVVRDMLLTGRSLSAERAHTVGLVSQVLPRGKGLAVARKVAEQACRFDGNTNARAKAFLKPLPKARLEQEKDLFVEMVGSPVVMDALTRFVTSTDVRPYLP